MFITKKWFQRLERSACWVKISLGDVFFRNDGFDISCGLPFFREECRLLDSPIVSEVLKAPYSSKLNIFNQEKFNKLIYGINTIIKYGIW